MNNLYYDTNVMFLKLPVQYLVTRIHVKKNMTQIYADKVELQYHLQNFEF